MLTPRVQCSPSLVEAVRHALGCDPGDDPDLLVLDAGDLGRLRPRDGDGFVPVLTVGPPGSRLACLRAGADAHLDHPVTPDELAAQADALLRFKQAHDRFAERTSEFHRVNERLKKACQQIDQELELAQRLQHSFLPHSLPQVPNVRFAVHYLLCGRVGGDFYDTFRLDEKHVGFYVADAMGHGVPASLLTIFVKKGVRAKEVFGNQYRLLPPDEVLTRLNRELIDQQLSEQPFITMAYGLLNNETGAVQIARAGHPYPLHVPYEGDVSLWKQDGMLLGFADARYPCHRYHLNPGDKLVFYSDGVDEARFGAHLAGAESLVACAARHRRLPVQEFIAALATDLFGGQSVNDDLTLLALERHRS